jgi:hypothetical protein
MSDCRDIVMQERLPDYLHGTLSHGDEAAVQSHVAVCSDCSEELDLLRSARRVIAPQVPEIRIDDIVAALPRPRTRVRRRTPVVSWRMAAALTVIVLGGLSLPTLRAYVNGSPITPDSLISDSVTQFALQVDSPRSAALPVTVAGSALSDLADEDLETLIGSMESLEAVPLAEPDVSARRFGVREGGN